MTLSRTEISDGLVNELRAFEQLIRPLSQTELDCPSRCTGWTVGDVARLAWHVLLEKQRTVGHLLASGGLQDAAGRGR